MRQWQKVRGTPLFKQQEDAWHEQRLYFDHALAALGPRSMLAATIKAEIAALDAAGRLGNWTAAQTATEPMPPASWNGTLVLMPASGGNGSGVALQIDPSSGQLTRGPEFGDGG